LPMPVSDPGSQTWRHLHLQSVIHGLAAALESSAAARSAEGSLARAAGNLGAALNAFEQNGEHISTCISLILLQPHSTVPRPASALTSTARTGCISRTALLSQLWPSPGQQIQRYCFRRAAGVAGYSAGFIMSVAILVGFVIVATVPGRDYDPSNGWVEHQEVPAIYDQRILEQVSCLLLSASCHLEVYNGCVEGQQVPAVYDSAPGAEVDCSIFIPFDGLS